MNSFELSHAETMEVANSVYKAISTSSSLRQITFDFELCSPMVIACLQALKLNVSITHVAFGKSMYHRMA